MRNLTLVFADGLEPELVETSFLHPLTVVPRRSVRGKRAGAYKGYNCFQWTKAVQALSVLVLEALSRQNETSCLPHIVGLEGSLASSLDYAIEKQPNWLLDMFGVDKSGNSLTKKLFLRTNPGQKRCGQVGVSLNLLNLSLAEIKIICDGVEVKEIAQIQEMKERLKWGGNKIAEITPKPTYRVAA